MRGSIQKTKIIGLCAIVGVLSFQTAVVAKKKPKRRSSRAAAAKRVNSLPRVFPFLVQTLSTTRPLVEANAPMLQATKAPRAPVLSGPTPSAVATAGQLIISEFRLRGPFGGNDQFVEIYNASGADHTVADSGVGTGYALAASDGVARCVIPNGTVIPNRGHYLCVNSVNYSLANYPSGNNGVSSTTATGDATYTFAIPDNDGIALFNTSVAANFTAGTRLDAVGSTGAPALYREGAGYPPLSGATYTSGTDYSFYRDMCGKGGSVTVFGPCPISTPKDTNDNAADFIFVDTNAASAGAGQRIGAPGPENLTAPIQRNASFTANLLDTTVSNASNPNRLRDQTSDVGNNSTFGTLSLRLRFTNNTGGAITRLRFRIIDLTTFSNPAGIADLRARSSTAVTVNGVNDAGTCLAAHGVATTPCTVTVQGTTLDQSDGPPPPVQQANGGGFNSSLSAGTVTLGTPVANGASINLQFLLGVQQTGLFKIYMNIEALP